MRTLKTDRARDLLEQKSRAVEPESTDISNPVIKIPDENYVPEIYTRTGSGTQLINVMFLLLNEQLGSAMERFHSCMCPACAHAVTRDALRVLPPVIVTVKRKEDERTVNELAEKHRPDVTKAIAKSIITVKSNPPVGHKRTD